MVRVPGRRRRRERRPDVHRHARGPRARDRRPSRAAADRLALPELRGVALVRPAHAEPARPARRDCSRTSRPATRSSSARSIRAHTSSCSRTGRGVARLFEVVRLAPMADAGRDRGRARLGGRPRARRRRRHARGGARPRDALPAAAAAPGNILRVLELVRDRIDARRGRGGDPETVIATLSDATGLPLHVLDPRAPLSLDHVREFFDVARARPARGGRVPRRPDRAREGGADRPDAAARRLPLRRPDRHRQDRDREGVQRLRLRLRGPARPPRHERVPDPGEPRAPPRRRDEAGGGGAADRRGAQAAVLRAPARRVREGARADLGRLPPGLRRRPPDRSERPHRRPAPLRDHPHLEPRLGDPARPGRRLRRPRAACSTPRT